MGATKKRNYSRFYAICKAKGIDLELYKDDLITEFTHGRTASLKEMTDAEYDEMCDCLQNDRSRDESSEAYLARRRKSRSAVLNRIQRLGVDTTDFSKVNDFCQNRRIAGKPFGMLSVEELEALVPKLESMLRKPRPQRTATPTRVISIPLYLFYNPNQLPN